MGKAGDKKAFDAAPSTHKTHPLSRIGRMIICVLTMGMVFPNAFSESVDITGYAARNNKPAK